VHNINKVAFFVQAMASSIKDFAVKNNGVVVSPFAPATLKELANQPKVKVKPLFEIVNKLSSAAENVKHNGLDVA
jgi:hypothetical protein